MYQEKGLYIPYAKMVKEAVNVPVICAGRMDNPQLAADAVQSGACDMISLGRPLLADADYVNKLHADRVTAGTKLALAGGSEAAGKAAPAR